MDWLKRVRCWIVGHRWYATLQAGHEYSFCARCSMPERDPAARERDALRQRAEQAEGRVRELEAERAELLENLEDTLNQACADHRTGLLDDRGLSAYEYAIDFLERLGRVRPAKKKGWYEWVPERDTARGGQGDGE